MIWIAPVPPRGSTLTAVAVASLVAAFATLPPASAAPGCVIARKACVTSARFRARGCERDCSRLADRREAADCRATCRGARAEGETACRVVEDPCAVACGAAVAGCAADRRACRTTARRAHDDCRDACDGLRDLRCVVACDRQRAAAEAGCGFVVAHPEPGPAEVPALPAGRAADLSALLDAAEQAVVAAADARAATLRTRELRLWVGRPGAQVTVTQTRHGFTFGFPIDFRRFRDAPDELAFYGALAADHTNLAVAEASLKWRNAEPEPGRFDFTLADAELAWAAERGLPLKGHTLFWGNAPPISTGSGIPVWLRERFPTPVLSAAERAELRALVRRQVETIVGRYRGRIAIWDVTNETQNVLTQWFLDRLGPEIVPELFVLAHAVDPGAQLVYNEWITEVFTGLPGPGAADVRDRVRALRAAGAPIHAVGQQGHFVPGVAYAGLPADLTRRTRIDDYAVALDTLAEAGLPVHITERGAGPATVAVAGGLDGSGR